MDMPTIKASPDVDWQVSVITLSVTIQIVGCLEPQGEFLVIYENRQVYKLNLHQLTFKSIAV